jgi:hypothetical protein
MRAGKRISNQVRQMLETEQTLRAPCVYSRAAAKEGSGCKDQQEEEVQREEAQYGGSQGHGTAEDHIDIFYCWRIEQRQWYTFVSSDLGFTAHGPFNVCCLDWSSCLFVAGTSFD